MRGLYVVLLAAAVVALPSGDVIVPEEDFSETAPQAEPENSESPSPLGPRRLLILFPARRLVWHAAAAGTNHSFSHENNTGG